MGDEIMGEDLNGSASKKKTRPVSDAGFVLRQWRKIKNSYNSKSIMGDIYHIVTVIVMIFLSLSFLFIFIKKLELVLLLTPFIIVFVLEMYKNVVYERDDNGFTKRNDETTNELND
jgi:Ca2+/Na+ antiporter